jgi:hypothetical protein
MQTPTPGPRYAKEAVDQQFARCAAAVDPAADLHPAARADQGQRT